MKYYIEYTQIPTRHNNTQVIETTDLSLYICLKDNLDKHNLDKLTFTNHAKRSFSFGKYGVLIGKVYKEDKDNNQIHVLYKYCEHFGETLKDILKTAPKEIFV